MGWTIINSVSAENNGSTPTTSSAIDTTGSDLIVVGVLCLANTCSPTITITDSQSNTWTQKQDMFSSDPSYAACFFYVSNPSTNASHTFTVSNAFGYISFGALAVSGSLTTSDPFDQSNGATQPTGATAEQPGSITPTQNGELLIAYTGLYNGASSAPYSIDNSFTQQTLTDRGTNNFGSIVWTLVQSTAAAINPTTTLTTGGSAKGDWAGIISFLPAPSVVWGFESESSTPQPRTAFLRPAGIFRGTDGIEGPFVNWKKTGWEIQPPPPPHTFIEKRGAIIPKDDGMVAPFILGRKAGWEVQPWQPPHIRFKNLDDGDRGIQAPYIKPPVPPPMNLSNELQSGWQPPHYRPEQKFAAIAPRDDGIYAPFVNWKNAGWEVQPWQPPYRFYKNLDDGDRGIQAKYIAPVPVPHNWGMELQSGWQPPLWPRKNLIWGALSHPEDGTEAIFVFVPPPPPPPPPPSQIVLSAADYRQMAVLGFTSSMTMYWDYSHTEAFYLLNAVGDGQLYRVSPAYAWNWFLTNRGAGLTEVYNPFRQVWFKVPSSTV